MPKELKKYTAAGVIRDGILANKTIKQILALLEKRVPDNNANESTVKHYARQLLKAKKLSKTKAIERYDVGHNKRGRKPINAKTKTAASSSLRKKAAPQKATEEKKPRRKTKATTETKKKPVAKRRVRKPKV